MFRGSLIFLFMVTLLLGACVTGLPSTLDDTLSIQGAEDELRDTATLTINNLPDEVMLQVFSELSVKDIAHASGVCKHWHSLSEKPALWRAVCLHIHGDYPASDATKEQAIKHMLRVHVNILTDLAAITQLVSKHKLNEEHPFKTYQRLLPHLYSSSSEMTDDYAAQGNEKAIERKIEVLAIGDYGHERNPKAAAIFIDSLVAKGNEAAIEWKIKGLSGGKYGYKKNLQAAAIFIDSWVEQGNGKAIERKIEALAYGQRGYRKKAQAAAILNDSLVEKGNKKAIVWKIWGLTYGQDGYKKNPKAAATFIDSLVEQGNEEAIKMKIWGLAEGRYGYEKNPSSAIVLNDFLVEQGNEQAMHRKIQGLVKGYSIYTQDTIQLKKWIGQEAADRKRWACYLKAQGLKYGILGFEKDRKGAIEYILSSGIPY